MPHILGFLNTPTRIYRFLTRRYLADDVGRATAAIVLANYRPFHQSSGQPIKSSQVVSEFASDESPPTSRDETASSTPTSSWEQQTILEHEEREWYSKARERKEGEGERVWLDPMVLDERIATKMRRFELTVEDETRAERIGSGKEGQLAKHMEGGGGET